MKSARQTVTDLKLTREEMISILAWNDSNGTFTDEDSKAEGLEPFTEAQAYSYLHIEAEMASLTVEEFVTDCRSHIEKEGN